MLLGKLSLQDVRLHQSLSLEFINPTMVMIGSNASGKTTILEAIALMSTGESFRASVVEQMINFEAELGRVKAELVGAVDNQSGQDRLEVVLTRGQVQGKRTAKRLFFVNGVKRPKKQAVGLFHTVLFCPEDMRLIEGSPGRRRSFMDTPLKLLDRSYANSLATYEKTLLRRNKLLVQVREGEQPRSVLQYWTMSLLKHGHNLQEKRRAFLDTFSKLDFPINFRVEYRPSVISEQRLGKYSRREVAAGHTLIGPHKDDLAVILDKRELTFYGSRGQQRLGVLYLKLGEFAYITKKAGCKPVLLLDDILSELDKKSRQQALELAKAGQVIITTTHQGLVSEIQSMVGSDNVQTVEL